MQQNISLGSNGVDRVRSLRKIPMRRRGTNFCSSSARFAPSFVRQPNGPECTQKVRNAPKQQFRAQWGGLGVLIGKIPTRLRGTNFCTSSARLAPSFVRQPNGPECFEWYEIHQYARLASSFVRQPNGPKCTQMVQNSPKHDFRVQWGGSSAFVAKNFDATSWHEVLH